MTAKDLPSNYTPHLLTAVMLAAWRVVTGGGDA
jgi:hypothetical protein